MAFYQLLHSMGVFGADAPSTMRAFATQGQLSPAQLIDRYGIDLPPGPRRARRLPARTPADARPHHPDAAWRQPSGGLFWRDLERHHPGICSLHLAPDVAAAWKQRVLIKTRRVTGPGRADQRGPGIGVPAALHDLGQRPRVLPRHRPMGDGGTSPLGAVGGAVPDPRRGPGPTEGDPIAQVPDGPAHPGTAPRPAGARGPRHTTQRPTPAAGLAAAPGRRSRRAVHLPAASCAAPRPGPVVDTARIWAEDPDTGNRRDLSGEEDRAFWTWAAVETLRHTGIRIEELTELSATTA